MTRPSLEHPRELLAWYVNATLEGDEQRRVEEHLAFCLACRREVEELRDLRRQVKAAAPEPPGDDGLQRLLREATSSHPPRRPRGWRPWLLAAAAVAATAMGVGVWHFRSPHVPIEHRAEEETPLRSLVSPEEPLPREAFLLRWEVAPKWKGARFTIRITAEDLEPVDVAQGLEEPQYLVPETALEDLAPGTRLFWQVQAVRPGETPVSSDTFRARIE